MIHHAPQPGVTVCAKSVNVHAAYTRSTRHAFLTPTRHGARVFQALSTDARLLRPNKHQNRPRCASSAKAPAANTVQHLEPGTAGCPRNMQSLRAAACGLRRRNSPTLPLHATKQPSCTVVGPASTGHSAALTACAARDCPHTLPRGPQGPLKQRMGGTHRLRFSRCSPQPASCATAFPPRHGPLGWGAPPTGTARGRALRRQGSDPNPTPARAGAAATRPPRPELQPSSWTVTGHTIGFALRQTNVFQTVKSPENDNPLTWLGGVSDF